MEVGGRFSLEVATKGSLRGKKTLKFGIIMPSSVAYILEVSAHVSLKAATEDSSRDKETMKI